MSSTPERRPVPEAVLANAAAAAAGLEPAIIVSSYFLEQCRQVAAALPGARVGYDPWRAVSRDPGLARDPSRLLRHLERRRDGVEIAYLHHGLVVGSEARGFPLVRRLLDLGIATDAPVVGIVARLDPLKGQDDLLDALPRIVQRMPDAKLLIVGDGWHRKHLEERVAKEGLAKHVVFSGLVPPSRVPEMLAAMDVNTLPSYQEGQPRTLVQALLCGTAIVAPVPGSARLMDPIPPRPARRAAASHVGGP